MTHAEQLQWLLRFFMEEQGLKRSLPVEGEEQWRLLRSLMNVRAPRPLPAEALAIQDAFLQEETRRKGVTTLAELHPIEPGLYLWRGDITTLAVDGIVNAGNSALLGCFHPLHGCIDNIIHTYAGVELRLACAKLMQEQGREEPVGDAKLTPAFNLPSRFVLHTVGPMVLGDLTREDEQALAACYRSCLDLGAENGLQSIAFCCISTGEFHFPNGRAAEIAVEEIRRYRKQVKDPMAVVFNVFKEEDEAIYRALLG